MTEEAVRVVYENRPYLVIRRAGGPIERAYGPFTPGTEPSLADCTPDNEVDSALVAKLVELIPLSPRLPGGEDSLAGR